MELMLNELSHALPLPDKYSADDIMILFSQTVAAARRRGFRNIRSHYDSHQIQLSNGYSLYDWLVNKDIPDPLRNNLYGMLVLPFIREDDEEEEIKYIEADYYFEDTKNNIAKTNVLGLAAAHLYDTLSISLQTTEAWKTNNLEIIIETNDSRKVEQVTNVFSKECFDTKDISDFVENLGDVRLEETAIPPDEKSIHLTAHHGQKEMKELWDKLKNSVYVKQGMTIQWGGKRFIRKVHSNGNIEIVDTDSDRGYALLVETTGRNFRETNTIAQILKTKFE